MTVAIRTPLAAATATLVTRLSPALGATLARALWRAPQAEWGLALQGAEVALSRDQSEGWLLRRIGPLTVTLGRPLGRPSLEELHRQEGRAILLYKCDARTAARARAAGWTVARLGWEAWLDPATWTAEGPVCRQLRRKLRAAARAGVAAALEEEPPLAELADVAAAWTGSHGRERGFSMGRFDGDLLRRQRVVVARREGRAVAFASLFACRREWSLDLLRHDDGVPDGTMHALVAAALGAARAEGVARLSLAAIPEPAMAPRWATARTDGLGQFKRSFGPNLDPLFAAAPGRAALALALGAVAWAIHHPPPLPPLDQKGFEPGGPPCDARGRLPGAVPVPFRSAPARHPAASGGADRSPRP